MSLFRRKRSLPLRISDIMSTPPITIKETEPVEKAAKLMFENNTSSVIVVNNDGVLTGIVTAKDVVAAVALGRIGQGIPVGRFMKENPLTISPDASITDALEKMREFNVRHLPVVDKDNRPIGMVSVRDIMDVLLTLLRIIE
ncbi:CBS domain-containing protein [Desulfurococcus mucosus]|uniref:Putative signal transduction protein with CBS domains n=1 Tax=Desulfurococcus mucosus (strain ATCC 35584 / DSM 2162 / JCM 9187 / O7/1) TaxID=765177 RepID=E8R8X2_DESM0|nr:CBS domain-containing protein [Desulfurococcus mucosus]ADV64948.1 putative signal transduction protein with CBS domains [Desulfurococcus mucosus DSM 2162]